MGFPDLGVGYAASLDLCNIDAAGLKIRVHVAEGRPVREMGEPARDPSDREDQFP